MGKMLATRVRRRSSRLMRVRPGGAQAYAVRGGEFEHRQAFRDGGFSPLGQLRVLLAPDLQCRLHEPLGLHPVRGVEDRAQLGGDGFSCLLTSDELSGVLLQMELATLPGNGGQHRSARRLESGVIVGDDELDAMQSAGEQAFEEAPPIDLGLTRGDRATQHPALAGGVDANRDQHRTIDDTPLQSHLLIAGIQEEIGHVPQRALAPSLEPLVELGGGTAYLGGRERNLRPQEALQDVDDATGGDALHVHLGQGEIDRLIGAGALFQGGRIEITGTHLGHLKGQFAHAGEHGLGLEAVGVVTASGRALVGRSAKELGALKFGRLIDEDAQRFTSAIESILEQHDISRFLGVGFDTHCHARFSFLEVMASCHRRAVLPGSRPGRYAPSSSARQNFSPAVKTEFTERTIHN